MLLVFGLVVGVTAEVEYGSLMGIEQSVTLDAGETFTVMANNFQYMETGAGADLQVYSPPSSESFIRLSFYWPAGRVDLLKISTTPDFGTIAGPCKIQLGSADRYCSYKITRHEVSASPMNIIALPEDNNGDVELLIETSTDLMSWTPVYSGSAGTSNNAAFFRTRLIQK